MPPGVRSRAALVAWTLVAASLVATVGHVVLAGHGLTPLGRVDLVVAGFLLSGTAALGALIVTEAPGNRVGWVMVAFVALPLVELPLDAYAYIALERGRDLRGGGAAMVLQALLGAPSSFGPILLLLLLFPTGSLPSRRWRPLAVVTLGLLVVWGVVEALRDGAYEYGGGTNPLGIVPPVIADDAIPAASTLGVIVATSTVFWRYRRAAAAERLQLRWVGGSVALLALGCGLAGLLNTLTGGSWVWLAVMCLLPLVPLSMYLAITRHGLYELDLVVSRALAYAALTAIVLAVYAAAVWGAGRLAHGVSDAAALVAAVVVAVGAAPLRDRLQRAANRLLYGQRDEPLVALAAFGDRLSATLEPDAVLPALVASVADAVRVPYVAVEAETADGPRVEAATGVPGDERHELPLVWEGERIGRLVLAPRPGGAPLDARDLRLVAGLARQAGPALHGVLLHREVQRSRAAVVRAREEERRRLRRDLHDGLGPQLSGMAARLGVVADRAADPRLAALARELEGETGAAIASVRGLIDELRPPQLDEHGLFDAIRLQAGRLGVGLELTVEADGPLAPLPAAVEVAAYRIALEAVANATRHAGARTCRVALRRNGALELEIADDGRGLPAAPRTGVGLVSMRERATELGGSLVVETGADAGTTVRARLPLGIPEAVAP